MKLVIRAARLSVRWRLLLAFPFAVTLGCTSWTPAYKVATAQNGYDYREARYEEACTVQAPPAECTPTVVEIHAAEKHLHEAAKAVKAGGGMPLQLNAIKADAKKLAKRKVVQ